MSHKGAHETRPYMPYTCARHTAYAAIPSILPVNPRPSVVFPLIPILDTSISNTREMFCFISSTCGATLGSWHTITESILIIDMSLDFRFSETRDRSLMLL